MPNALNKVPIVGFVLSIRNLILLLWSWISRNAVKCKVFALCSLTYASIRAAIGLLGYLYTRINSIVTQSDTFGGVLASSGSTSSGFFDKVNAVLPVAETLAFLVAYVGVMIATTAYMFARSVYKAIPAKAT